MMNKKVIFGSIGAAGVVALLAVLDVVVKVPFGGNSIVMDGLYLAASGIVIYMGFETIREMK